MLTVPLISASAPGAVPPSVERPVAPTAASAAAAASTSRCESAVEPSSPANSAASLTPTLTWRRSPEQRRQPGTQGLLSMSNGPSFMCSLQVVRMNYVPKHSRQWRSKALRGPGSTVTWRPSLSLPSNSPSLSLPSPFPSSSPAQPLPCREVAPNPDGVWGAL